MSARRKQIKLELTTYQIDKLWAFLGLPAGAAVAVKLTGKATADDTQPGRVRGWVTFEADDDGERS